MKNKAPFDLFCRLAATVQGFASRFAGATRGNVALMFGLALPVLIMVTMGAVDIHEASKVKSNLQDALDAATLAAARSKFADDANLHRIGMDALKANMPGYFGAGGGDTASFSLEDNTVVGTASVNVKVIVANIVLPPYGQLLDEYILVGGHSEVLRASRDIEVAMVLDVTGSMKNTRIAALKDAARELVDLVVQDVQTPFYSRMAIIPYSSGVNLNAIGNGFGNYTSAARGTPTPAFNISGAAWLTGSPKNLSGATRAASGVLTSNNHAFKNGEFVWIKGVSGMTQLNAKAYRVASSNTNTLQLQQRVNGNWTTVDTRKFGAYSSGGTIQKCLVENCSVVITAAGHNLPATDPDTGQAATVLIKSVKGMTAINDKSFEIADVTATTFSIGVNGSTYSAYTSGGQGYCGMDGCQYRIYRNASNSLVTYPISNCVTERTGSQYNTETRPSVAPVGRLYPSETGDNICTKSPMLPLTHNRTAMLSLLGTSGSTASGLQAGGYTAGHVGLAWGWYALSPEFNSFWPTAPAPYDAEKTLKAVILMTDGEFNMTNCSGAPARNADQKDGARIQCDSAMNSYTQARALCTGIKNKEIVLYTVGFQVTASSEAGKFLQACASSADRFHIATSNTDLREAFRAIGRDITRLRIAR